MKHIFNPTPSPAIIQAFALLALWSPFDASSPSSTETHDSRLIAAAAVNMCSSLRFDQAATDEQVLKERCKLGAELTPQETALLTSAEQKKLLVSSFHTLSSIAQLTNTPSLLPVDVCSQRRIHVRLYRVTSSITPNPDILAGCALAPVGVSLPNQRVANSNHFPRSIFRHWQMPARLGCH